MAELLIYTPQITQRVKYIFQLFFDSLIRTPYNITTDEAVFRDYNGPKLNYSTTDFPGVKLQVIPSRLLVENDIRHQNLYVSRWNQLDIFYATDKGSLPFDIFSATFYLVSRYEEYLLKKSDEHKRFPHKNSLAHKNYFLDRPLVNLWAEELKKIILTEYPAISFSENKYSFIPTIDIDVAYAHLGRNIFVTIGSYLKALSRLQIKTLIEKKLVLLRLKKDPYDTFSYQESIFKKYNLHPIYFFLAAGKRSSYDKNIPPGSKRFKRLVKKLSSYAEIAIHPSYRSKSDPKIVAEEIKMVEQNISKKITCSRQHFLKLSLPDTYRCLAELGITDDYSMAYAGTVGFRASICTPFFFYDLKAENVLPVKVHSSSIMDGTMKDYLTLSRADSIAVIRELVSKIKSVNGEFIPIWHNHSINNQGRWEGWRTIFEFMMETGVK